MKAKYFLPILLTISILLTGCVRAVPLSTEQSDLLAQYAAGVVYKHSYSFLNKYPDYDMNNPVEEETTTEEETPVIDPDAETTAGTEPTEKGSEEETEPATTGRTLFAVAEALSISPAEVYYLSARTTKEYPDGDDVLFSMPADDGCVFLVVNFELANPSTEEITLNTIDSMPVFRVTFADGNYYSNYGSLSLIQNELSGLKDFTVNAGGKADVVLLFMVDEKYADNLGTFTISYGDAASIEVR